MQIRTSPLKHPVGIARRLERVSQPKRNPLPGETVRVNRDTRPRRNFLFKLLQVVHHPQTPLLVFRCLKTTTRFSDQTCALLIQQVMTDHNLRTAAKEKL